MLASYFQQIRSEGGYKAFACLQRPRSKFQKSSTMSIARQIFREFRPLFRMLEEPFGRTPAYFPHALRSRDRDNFLTDPFAGLNMLASPAVDVTEKGNKYIIEADIPGVSKDNLQVRVGDGNQSITIEGKVAEKILKPDTGDADNSSSEYTDGMFISLVNEYFIYLVLTNERTASKSTSLTNTDENATHISVERPLSRSYSFTRTVWLPRPVDPNNVSAKLQNGVLSVTLNQVPDESGKVVNIEVA